ncbi:hypothetical protein ACSVHC_07220 [Arthrobacter sp. KNU-44]|uniref:hypothetical protein n=1 Tax=Arthrobacter sp. KNU-44 TaxID=3450744 RepID=UPI003F442F53
MRARCPSRRCCGPEASLPGRPEPSIRRGLEDAPDEHGVFRGDREEYIAWVILLVRGRFAVPQHVFGQTRTRLDGDDEEKHAGTGFMAGSMDREGRSYVREPLLEDRALAL